MEFPESANMRDGNGKIKKPLLPGHESPGEIFISGDTEACIQNIMYKKQFITREEALILIQNISGALLIDARITGSKKKYCSDI